MNDNEYLFVVMIKFISCSQEILFTIPTQFFMD